MNQVIQVKTPLDQKIHENCATSPLNDIPQPTMKEAKAGDYEKANIKIAGLKIAIENPYGSVRKGIDPNGKQWECKLKDNYGEVSNSEGADGDPVDVFIKPHLTQAEADKLDKVFIVDQQNPDTGEFDEHKVVLGYETKADAEKAYLSNYAKGWRGIGGLTEMDMDSFKTWLKTGNLKKPVEPLFHLLDYMDSVLDAVTQSHGNQAIAELKSKFQAVNGLGKIRLAREILDARKANIAQPEQNVIVSIDFSEPEWTSDARINQKLIAEKLVAWIRVLSEKTVYSSSAFAKAFNKSEFSAWLKIGKSSIGKTFYFETINKPDTLRINEFDGSYLSLINVVMKLANQPIFDSVNMILDDTTNAAMTIANLKNQFPTANGMGKIKIAREILAARAAKIIPDMSVNIDLIANKPAASITKEMYAGAVIKLKESHPDLEVGDLETDEHGRVVANAKVSDKDFGSVTIGRLISDLSHRYDPPKTPSIPQKRTVTKPATKEVKELIERAHITAANVILEKVKNSNKYRLTQKPFHHMANADRGDFKRLFGDGYEGQKKAKSYAKSIDFVEQMAKEDRPITAKQKDWLAKIAAEHYVSYDKDADKTSARTLAKDKTVRSSSTIGSYEDADMPEYDPATGKWYDMETGLEIMPPKSPYASRSYL